MMMMAEIKKLQKLRDGDKRELEKEREGEGEKDERERWR